MFETSVIAQPRTASRRLSLLSVSFFAHTAMAFGVVAAGVASVRFPAVAPDEYARAPVFATVQIPPPFGNPNGGGPKPQTPPVKPPAPQPANQQTAPAIVPENVTPVASDAPSDGPIDPTATVPGPRGVPWGEESSPGPIDAPPVFSDAPVQPPAAEVIYQPHEVVAPVLVRKVDPRYPQALVRVGMPATVVVRCVIDKHGNVRDPEVVVPSSMAPFNAEVLNVLPNWKYKPATLAGQPVNSYLMLTVHFAVKR